jgi:hypothetical protein
MLIDVDPSVLDGLVRGWLKETLETLEHNAAVCYVHPEDAKEYLKDIKAVRRLLDYVGRGA